MVLCRKRFGETAFGRLFQVKLELGREPGTEASSITHVVLTHAEQRNVLLICQVSDGETCLNVEVIRNLRRPVDAYGVQGVVIQMGCCISWERYRRPWPNGAGTKAQVGQLQFCSSAADWRSEA